MNIRSCLIPAAFLCLTARPAFASAPFLVELDLATKGSSLPSVILVHLFENEEDETPLDTQYIIPDQILADRPRRAWRGASPKPLRVQVEFDIPREPGVVYWAEYEVAGEKVGQRFALQTGDASFAGFIESRSGGIVFPDGSVQTAAMDAACAAGSSIRSIGPDNSFTCEVDDGGGGTVTSVGTGNGLAGGPITTAGEISIASGGIENSMLAAGSVTADKVADGAVTSAKIADGAVTAVKIDSSTVQQRVTGTCTPGLFVTAINADGTIECANAYDFLFSPIAFWILDDSVSVGQTSIAVGQDGLPIISYHDRSNNNLRVAKCRNTRCSGNDIVISTVDDNGSVGWHNAIAIGKDGRPVISYYDATNKDLKVAKCNDLDCAGGDETISTVDGSGDSGSATSIAIGSDGMPVISYYDRSNTNLKVAKCDDAACSGEGESISSVDGKSLAVGDIDTAIVIGADGYPVVAYMDSTNSKIRVAKCNDPACSGGNETITALTATNPLTYYASLDMVIGNDDFPVISYMDNLGYGIGALKVVKCNDAACAGNNESIRTVDYDPEYIRSVGDYSSIALGADGLPVISYRDQTKSDLKIAKCTSATCAAKTLVTSPDKGAVVGSYTSIAVDDDGLPVVSYVGGGALRFAKCRTTDCSE